MKNNGKNKFYLAGILTALVFSLGAGISFLKVGNPFETLGERVGPTGQLPKKINITDLDDDEVNDYYSSVEGLSGDDLKEALNLIIKDHHEYDYTSSTDRNAYKIMDRNWTLSPASEINLDNYNYNNDNPYIRKLYADYNDDIATADRFKNVGASRVSFDKEHIWAQSLGAFGRKYGGGSDFHHLLPSDVKGNQAFHSNNNFGEPDTNRKEYLGDYETSVGYSGYVADFSGGHDQKVVEPLMQYRGDVARAMLYMPVRYNVHLNEDHPHLELVNGSPAARPSTVSQSGLSGDLATLLKWHVEDPVDSYEIHRNNLIYNNFQLNRNPFIDHPEWAKMIYDPTYSGVGASTASGTSTAVGQTGVLVESITLSKTVHSMDINQEFSLSATISPTNAEIKALSWFSSNPNIATVLNGRISSLTYGTTTITAAATDGSGVSATCELTVEPQIIKEVDRLEVFAHQERISFGKAYPINTLIVYLYYEDESFDDVTSAADISLPNTHLLGEQIVNVQYGEYSATYEVFVTNDDALLSYSEEGLWYESPVADEGIIENWTGHGLGTPYNNGDVKLDNTGDYIYKTDIWDETNSQNITEMDVVVMIKYYTGGSSVTNELSLDLLNDDLGSVVATEKKVGLNKTTFTEVTYSFTFDTPKTITGIKFTYTLKGGGNYALRYVLAKPNYQHNDHLIQAEAWATYFLNKTSAQCLALEPQKEEDWILLGEEFNLMHSTSKAYFTSSTDSQLVLEAIDRYNAIIRAHPENASFIVGLENTQTNVLAKTINQDTIAVLIIIAILSLTVILFFVLRTYRKTKKHETN